MKLFAVILVVATLAVIQAGAIPKKEEKHGKDRVYDKVTIFVFSGFLVIKDSCYLLSHILYKF